MSVDVACSGAASNCGTDCVRASECIINGLAPRGSCRVQPSWVSLRMRRLIAGLGAKLSWVRLRVRKLFRGGRFGLGAGLLVRMIQGRSSIFGKVYWRKSLFLHLQDSSFSIYVNRWIGESFSSFILLVWSKSTTHVFRTLLVIY